MIALSATDLAIAAALETGTLDLALCWSDRLRDYYYSLSDEHGLIETHLTVEAARAHVAAIQGAQS